MALNTGLAVSDIANVQVVMSPIAAAIRSFGTLLILGSSAVIDTTERIRQYSGLTGVAADFSLTSPEYQAAALFFGQTPQPSTLYIGRWAQTATSGLLHGNVLSAAAQALANFTAVTSGGMNVTVDGVAKALTGINLSGVTNLNGVASAVTTALAPSATCTWNASYSRFDITSASSGTGVSATGSITLTTNPIATDTVTVGGTAITFVASGATGNQVNIGASSAATAANLQAFLAASTDTNIAKATYSTTGNVTTVTYATVGTTGNAFTLAKTGTNVTVSGATLSGGVNASTLSFGTAPGSGTDISSLMGLQSTQGGSLVQGIAAESLVSAVNTHATSNSWYGLTVAASGVVLNDHLAVSAFIEGASPSRAYGITTQDTNVLSATSTTDVAAQMQSLGYNRTMVQYSSSNAYAVTSLLGRAFTVDFTGFRTTLTLKFKQEPGVTAETINETQAATLKAKNCNVFVNYNNSTAIVQEGVMSGGWFFDERHGLDWLQQSAQNSIWNTLYTSPTKIPQTDEGVNQLISGIERDAMVPAVTNGLLAPGVWTGPAIGALQPNQTLTAGYYIYAPSVATQSAADRAARKAPTPQIATKLAGAIHFSSVVINVNR